MVKPWPSHFRVFRFLPIRLWPPPGFLSVKKGHRRFYERKVAGRGVLGDCGGDSYKKTQASEEAWGLTGILPGICLNYRLSAAFLQAKNAHSSEFSHSTLENGRKMNGTPQKSGGSPAVLPKESKGLRTQNGRGRGVGDCEGRLTRKPTSKADLDHYRNHFQKPALILGPILTVAKRVQVTMRHADAIGGCEVVTACWCINCRYWYVVVALRLSTRRQLGIFVFSVARCR